MICRKKLCGLIWVMLRLDLGEVSCLHSSMVRGKVKHRTGNIHYHWLMFALSFTGYFLQTYCPVVLQIKHKSLLQISSEVQPLLAQ